MGGFSQWEMDSAQATKDLATDVTAAAKPYVQDAADFWNDAKAAISDPDDVKTSGASFWANAKQQEADKLKQSVSYSATQNQAEYAKNLRLGQQTGVSPEVAKDYTTELTQAAASSRMNYLNFAQQSPRTTSWAMDPQNAAVAGVDELHRVGAIEQHADIIRALTPSQVFEQKYIHPIEAGIIRHPLGRFLYDVLGGAENFAGNIGAMVGIHGTGPDQKNRLQLDAESFKPEYYGLQSQIGDEAARSVGPIVLTLPIGGAGGALEAVGMSANAANIAVGLTTGAAFTADMGGAAYTAMKQAGASDEVARTASYKVAAINAPFQALFGFTHMLPERVAASTLSEMLAAGESEAVAQAAAKRAAFLVGTASSAGVGGLTGGAGQVGQNWITGQPLTKNVWQSAVSGAASLTGMHLGFGFVEQMAGVIAHTDQSQLKKISPEKFKDAMQTVFAGQESLRIPVEQFETYFQSQNMDPAAVAQSLGVQNYAEAHVTGDVEVQTPDFISKLDTQHQEALLGDIKDPATDMTFNQKVQGQKELQEWVKGAGPEKLREMTEAVERSATQPHETRPLLTDEEVGHVQAGFDALKPEEVTAANTMTQEQLVAANREANAKAKELVKNGAVFDDPEFQRQQQLESLTRDLIPRRQDAARFHESHEEVKAELKKRLMAAGYTEPVAEANAAIEANFHSYLARETGRMPHEVLALTNPRVVAGEAPERAKAALYQAAIENIRSVVEASKGPGHAPQKAVIAPVEDWLAQTAKGQGFDIDGYQHVIDGSAIRHVINEHGNAETEVSRGNLPITHEDFEKIPEVLAEPDRVIFGTKNRIGRDQIGYAKRMPDGSTLYVEEIRTGRKELAAVSMRKFPATMDVDDVAANLHLDARDDGIEPIVIRHPSADKNESTLYQGPVDRAEDRQWRNHEPETTSTGKIKGAPENVNNRQDLNAMRGRLRRLVQEGLAGRFWYEQSAQAVMKMVGGDIKKAEKFMQLLAIYSPNSNVWVNTLQAVRAYTHWAAGRPESEFRVGSERADNNAKDVLYRDTPWEGRKTNSFYLNLMHDIVKNYPQEVSKLNLDPAFVTSLSKPATIDVWMGRAFEYSNTSFTDDKGSGKYSFSENEVRRLTAELNSKLKKGEERWTPHQVQAAIWTAMKTRYEMPDVKAKTNAKGFKEGLLKTVVKDGKKVVQYPSDPEGSRQHYANWHNYAMQPTSAETTALAEEQARSFGDDMERLTQTVTWEANPSKSLGLDISKASPEVQRMFTAVARGLLMGPQDEDLLAHMLGVPLSYGTEGHGAFEGDVSPNILSHLLPARAEGQEGFNIDEVRAYARAIQYIYKQDAVPWFRAENKGITSEQGRKAQLFRVRYPSGAIKTFDTQAEAETFARNKGTGFTVQGGDLARAMVFHFDKTLDPDKLRGVLTALQEFLGKDAGYTKTADNEVMVVNFRDDQTKVPFARTDEEFADVLSDFLAKHGKSLGIDSRKAFWAQGEYGNVHDWSKDVQGESLLASRGLSGRPDLQAWLRDRRGAFDSLLQEYSGENLAKLEDAAKALYAEPERAEPAPQPGAGEPATTGPPAGGTLYQSGEQRPRGWITFRPDGSFEIGSTPRADLSTRPHEFAHAYMKMLETLSQREGASDVIKKDYATVLDFLGAKAGEPLTEEQQEKFARAREQYLREGKAPNKGMRGVFQRFGVWLSSIYKKASDLGVELTPEMRDFFARAHAGEEAVSNAEMESGPSQFDSPEQAGWTEEKFEQYAQSRGIEVGQAKAEIAAKLDAAARRERTDAWQEEEQGVRAAKTDEIDARPEYQAIRALRKGESGEGEDAQPLTLNKDELIKQFGEDRVAALQKQHRGLYRLEGGTDAQTAAEVLGYSSGEELIKALESAPRRSQAIEQETRQYMTEKHGDIRYDGSLQDKARVALENNQRAERMHDELKALQKQSDPAVQLKEAQRQLAQFEKAKAAEEKQKETSKAAKDFESLANVLLKETGKQKEQISARDQKIEDLKQRIKSLEESIKQGKQEQRAGTRFARAIPPLEAFRTAAHEMVESKPVVDLQPQRYLDASRKFAREAYTALARGDYWGAKEAKQKELMNHFLYREASKAKDFIADFEAYTKRAQGKNFQQTLGKAGGDYRNQFNGLMVRYGLMPGKAQATGLDNFVQAQYDLMKEPAIDPTLLDETRTLNYKNAPISEVRIVNEALKNIRKLANQELGMIVNGRKVVFENAVQAMAARAREKNKVTPERVLQRNATVGEKAVNLVDWGDATLLPAERLMEMLDGGPTGPWHDNLWNLAADSQGAEEAMNVDVTRKVQEAFERMPKEMRDSMMDKISVSGIPETVTRHELISMALNMGNEGNASRLMKTFEHHGWDQDVIEQLKNGILSKQDWEFVQGIWNIIEDVGKKSFAFEERMNGVPPVKVAPEPFDVKLADGTNMHMEGGYFPVHMDPRFSHAGAVQDASTTAQGLVQPGYTRATTSRGFLKERSGYGGPLLFDYEQTLTQHLTKVIKDLTHREFMFTANKLLMHPTVRSAIRETMGGKYEEQMLPWLQTIVNNRNGSATQGLGIISAGIRELRKNVVIASLGFKAGTNILQVLHAPRMMLYTRPGAYLQALSDFIVRPREFMQQIRELSPNEMASRGMHGDRDTREMIQEMSGQKGWTSLPGVRDKAVLAGMATFKYIDQMMSFPLWMSVYRDARVANAHLPEAESKYQSMQAADRAVRLGLGAHSPKDLAPIMRNNDVTKLITVLYGFHSGVYGQLRAMGHELRYNGVKGIPRFTYGALIAVIVPSILSSLARGKGPDKDENPGAWAAKNSLMYSFQTIPILRDVLSAIEFHKDVKISPIVDLLDKAVRIGIESQAKNKDYTGMGLDALELGGTVAGVPGTAQVIKPLRYYHRVDQGKIQHPNLYDAFIGSGAKH